MKHVLELQEEAGMLREYPCMLEENMQTFNRKNTVGI